MTRDEVKELIRAIDTFYPKKIQATTELIDAWARKLEYIDMKTAMKNLDDYVDQDEAGRVPTIARIIRTDKLQSGVSYNMEYRKTMKLTYWDKDTYIDQNGMLWAYPEGGNGGT